MEPRIRYARTSDGVRIAYYILGEGPPLVLPPMLVGSHLQLEWNVPTRRASYQGLCEHSTVVRYDARGTGMSQRDVPDYYSEAASALDLEAVADAAGRDRFALYFTRGASCRKTIWSSMRRA